jgi:hypothetical protein
MQDAEQEEGGAPTDQFAEQLPGRLTQDDAKDLAGDVAAVPTGTPSSAAIGGSSASQTRRLGVPTMDASARSRIAREGVAGIGGCRRAHAALRTKVGRDGRPREA